MARDTREAIINAFFRLAVRYPKKVTFTLTEIAKEAQISRQTIYKNHFNCFEEIIDYIHEHLYTDIAAVYSTYNPDLHGHPLDFIAKEVLPQLYKHRIWIKYLYTTSADPYWRLFLKETFSSWVEEHIKINHHSLKMSKGFALDFTVLQLLSIMEFWLSHDFPTPPKLFCQKFLKLANTALTDYTA